MNQERTYFLKEIEANVLFKKKKGIRRLSIRINKTGEIIVTLPYLVSFREAEKFLLSRKTWVEKTRIRVTEGNPKQTFAYGQVLETHFHKVFVVKTEKTKLSCSHNAGRLTIFIPETIDIDHENAQAYIKTSIIELLRNEAKKYLPTRLKQLANEYSYSFQEVRIKNMKSRWGSCSARNNINLNLHLMRLPKEYIDYVLLHELVHTVHKNHGLKFWNELNHKLPQAPGLSKIIRKINPENIVMIKEKQEV